MIDINKVTIKLNLDIDQAAIHLPKTASLKKKKELFEEETKPNKIVFRQDMMKNNTLIPSITEARSVAHQLMTDSALLNTSKIISRECQGGSHKSKIGNTRTVAVKAIQTINPHARNHHFQRVMKKIIWVALALVTSELSVAMMLCQRKCQEPNIKTKFAIIEDQLALISNKGMSLSIHNRIKTKRVSETKMLFKPIKSNVITRL